MVANSTKRSFEELNSKDEFITLYCDIFANRNISVQNKKKRWDSLSEERKSSSAVALAALKVGISSPFELPDSLLSCKKFALQANTIRSDTWYNLVPKLKLDPDILMCTLSTVLDSDTALEFLGDAHRRACMKTRWRRQKQARIAMDKLILPAMTISSKHDTEMSPLYILNQGDHHVNHLLAEYLDYPFGTPLTLDGMERAITWAATLF